MIQQHNSRTSHFVRACGAFAYITIPAIACPLLRFDLYLVSGQIALTNECYGQGILNFSYLMSPIVSTYYFDNS